MKKREEERGGERDGGCPLGRTWARGGVSVPVSAQEANLPSEGLIDPPVHTCGLPGPGGQ